MKPWLTAPMVISRAALDEVERHARECHPDEACGLLTGPADDPALVTACLRFTNEADRYHRLDPAAYPRTAREAYRMNDKRRGDAVERGERDGHPVKVLYHSHCDVGAYFSEEDRTQALTQSALSDDPAAWASFDPEGTLVGQVAWLVTSVREGGVVDDHKLFVFDPATRAFDALPFTVE